MTKRELMQSLMQRIEDLEQRVAALESRPMFPQIVGPAYPASFPSNYPDDYVERNLQSIDTNYIY